MYYYIITNNDDDKKHLLHFIVKTVLYSILFYSFPYKNLVFVFLTCAVMRPQPRDGWGGSLCHAGSPAHSALQGWS